MNILERIYSLPSPPPHRTRPMEVICVGPSRSGTDSLRTALLELGYSNVHHGYSTMTEPWQKQVLSRLLRKKYRSGRKDGNVRFSASEFDQLFAAYDACTDQSTAIFAAELATAYPEAKVILNRRTDVDAWFTSTLNTFGHTQDSWSHWLLSFFCADLYWSRRLVFAEVLPWFYRGDYRANAKWVFREHCAMVRGIVPKERLLEWGPEEGWEPLCEFLGKKKPEREFPSGNTVGDFVVKQREGHRANRRRAQRNMAVTGFVVGVVIGGVIWKGKLREFGRTGWEFVRMKVTGQT